MLYDINDILLFIHNFEDDYFTANFKSIDIEKAKTKILNKFNDLAKEVNLKNNISEYQFKTIKLNIKDQIRKELLN